VVVGGAVTVLDVDGVADSSAGSPRPDDEEEVLNINIQTVQINVLNVKYQILNSLCMTDL